MNEDKRRFHVSSIRRLVEDITRPIYAARDPAEAKILAHWPAIVGKRLSELVSPVKLATMRGEVGGATLHVHIYGASALEIQHREPQIIEKISTYLGYKAVARLKLIQKPKLPEKTAGTPQKLMAHSARHRAPINGIEDKELQAALEDLGKML